ncbi:MAG TPA: CocE/NonD family hydrolase, partial [Bryobacteraceae bacterium]|nr:CocE/NonD family hydrolase [Bryobacteraceae bacterium]
MSTGLHPRSSSLFARIRRRLGNILRPNVEVFPVPAGIHADWNLPVPVRDGTILRVNVFRPASGPPAPVIMSAHPYNKDRIPARTRSGRGIGIQYRMMPQPHPVRFSAWTSWEAPDPAFWVPRGYAVVNADLRGGGAADGANELLSDQEAEDYYDLIEWVGAQPWSSGRVGLDGVSYLALSQYKVAALHPPHLAAICPWEGFSDLYRDFARPGGAREDGFLVFWSRLTRKAARIQGDVRAEVVTRPERDQWYESHTPALERIDVPMLVCGSFSDHSLHTRGSFEVFRRAGSGLKFLYTHRDGKWCAYYSDDATQARLRFFDHTLKGISNGIDQEPPVRLAIYDEGPNPVAVESSETWPPPGLTWTSLHLAPNGQLQPGSISTAGQVAFSTRGKPATFEWTFDHDVDVIGPMALRVHIEISGAADAVLFAGIRKFRGARECVFEGSYGFSCDMVAKGWQRLAHRDLDGRLSTPEQPVHTHAHAQPLSPGEIIPVDIALLPQATRFLRGDRLRLDLRGNWHYPRDPFRGTFPAAYQRNPRARCTIHCGGPHASRLLLGMRPV